MSPNNANNQIENLRQEIHDENAKLRNDIESIRQEFVVATAEKTATDGQLEISRQDLLAVQAEKFA